MSRARPRTTHVREAIAESYSLGGRNDAPVNREASIVDESHAAELSDHRRTKAVSTSSSRTSTVRAATASGSPGLEFDQIQACYADRALGLTGFDSRPLRHTLVLA